MDATNMRGKSYSHSAVMQILAGTSKSFSPYSSLGYQRDNGEWVYNYSVIQFGQNQNIVTIPHDAQNISIVGCAWNAFKGSKFAFDKISLQEVGQDAAIDSSNTCDMKNPVVFDIVASDLDSMAEIDQINVIIGSLADTPLGGCEEYELSGAKDYFGLTFEKYETAV